MANNKVSRGNASQFFIAGELCRRGYSAVVTLGNTPNVDILCSNSEGTRFAHVQVKTFVPGKRTCSVGMKATKFYGESFFWILGGIPLVGSDKDFEYFIIPSRDMSENITESHEIWLATPGRNGRPHQDNSIRTVLLPPRTSANGWDISSYRNRWDIIGRALDSTK